MYVCIYIYICVCVCVCFPPMARQPLVGQGFLIIEALRPHSVGLLCWTSDRPDAETST